MADRCADVRCARYSMSLAEFRKLRGETWDDGFNSRIGKLASKLCRDLYGKVPPARRQAIAGRNKVPSYPCGIIEQAYRQLVAQGVPLVSPPTPNALMRQRMKARAEERRASKSALRTLPAV